MLSPIFMFSDAIMTLIRLMLAMMVVMTAIHGVSFVSTIKALCVLWQAVSYLEHTLFNEPATDALDCE